VTIWDWIILAAGAGLVVEGLWKGAVRLAFGLCGLLLGYLYAGFVADRLAPWAVFVPGAARRPVTLAVGFLAILAGAVVAGIIVSKIISGAGLGWANRLLGALLGFVLTVYLAGGMVRMGTRYSPELGRSMARGPVAGLLAGLAVGLEAIIPIPDLVPAPRAAPPPPAATQAKGGAA
jgi:uncharacterized membrane protein required for colicin V production